MTLFQRTLLVAITATAVAGYGLFASMSDPLPSWLVEAWVPYLAGVSLLFVAIAAIAWAVVLVILFGRIARWVWTGNTVQRAKQAKVEAIDLTIGEVEVAQFTSGGEFLLPLKIGPSQQAECRVVLTLGRVGGDEIPAASYVLKTKHAIEHGDKQAGRVNLDDAFKRFVIMSCYAGSENFLVEAEAGDYWIPRDSYSLTITIAGIGAARRRDYVLQDEGKTLRICSDTRNVMLQAA